MRHKKNQQGFTIIELLFATAAFSIVLLVCIFAIIRIGRMYYKAVISSKTQNASRNLLEEISKPIQLGGTAPTITGMVPPDGPGSGVFCIGDKRYSYVINKAIKDNLNTDSAPGDATYPHAVWRDTKTVAACSPAALNLATPSGNGQELLEPRMRLRKLEIRDLVGDASLWKVTVQVVYGDNDVLDGTQSKCLGSSTGHGAELCAVSELSTVVNKR